MNNEKLLQETDLCVKCGLCLPHCPTYRLRKDEGESPRGRISLIQGLVQGDLSADKSLQQHLENCLHCLNCSVACPSGVKYSGIIDAALNLLPIRRGLMVDAMAQFPSTTLGRSAIGVFRDGPLYSLSLKVAPQPYRNLLRLLPRLPKGRLSLSSCWKPSASDIYLFLGCATRLVEQTTFEAFLTIANKLGFTPRIPSNQVCCGAIYGHGGNQPKAKHFQDRNIQSFDGANHIISFASGCGAYLQTYLGDRLIDASAFLAQTPWLDGLRPKAFNGLIAIHTPCSLRNSMKSGNAVMRLIDRIPDVRYTALSSGYGCCGGAGMHLIEQPDTAQQLLAPFLDEIRRLQPKVVLTSNTGCRLHMQRGLLEHGMDIPVRHPVELIADLLA